MEEFAKMMKALFIVIFVLFFCGLIAIFLWLYLGKPYQTEVLETKYDEKGRLILKKERGGAFREGWFDKTLLYDTLGNLIDEFGYETHTKYRKIFLYNEKWNLIKQTYYYWDSDLVQDTTQSFEIADSLIQSQEVYQYYKNGQKSMFLYVYFTNYPQDTSSIDLAKYDSLGNVIIRKTIDYEWRNIIHDSSQNIMEYDRYRIAYDSLNNQRDTIKRHIKKQRY